jgi:hypothetical protein
MDHDEDLDHTVAEVKATASTPEVPESTAATA